MAMAGMVTHGAHAYLMYSSLFLVFDVCDARDNVFDAAKNKNKDDTIVAVGG
jgi:hypothetical protein